MLEGEVGRLESHQPFRDTGVFGKAPRFQFGIHLVARTELRDTLANGLDNPCDILASNDLLRSAKPEGQTRDERETGGVDPVRMVDRRGADSNEYIVVGDLRPHDVLERQNICRAVRVLNDCLHGGCL